MVERPLKKGIEAHGLAGMAWHQALAQTVHREPTIRYQEWWVLSIGECPTR